MDWRTRKLLPIAGIHHLKADVKETLHQKWNGGHGLIKLESAYNAAAIGLSKYIKQGKDLLTRLVQEYAAAKNKYSLQNKANLIKQKYMMQETAAQTIKNKLKSSSENEKIEDFRGNQCMDNSTRTLEDHQ